MSEMAIELVGVRKRFGRNEVLHGVDLHVPVGKTLCVFGAEWGGEDHDDPDADGAAEADGGTVRVNGAAIRRRRRWRFGRLSDIWRRISRCGGG